MRRALNRNLNLKVVVSAWAQSNNLVLGQIKLAAESKEITALPKPLRRLNCLAVAPGDLRGSCNRLFALTQSVLREDPLSDHCFGFADRHRRRGQRARANPRWFRR